MKLRVVGGPIPRSERLTIDVDPRRTTFRDMYALIQAAWQQRIQFLGLGRKDNATTPITPENYYLVELEEAQDANGAPTVRPLRPFVLDQTPNEKGMTFFAIMLREVPQTAPPPAPVTVATVPSSSSSSSPTSAGVRVVGGPILKSDRIIVTADPSTHAMLSASIIDEVARRLPGSVHPPVTSRYYELFELEVVEEGGAGGAKTRPLRRFQEFDPVDVAKLRWPILLLKRRTDVPSEDDSEADARGTSLLSEQQQQLPQSVTGASGSGTFSSIGALPESSFVLSPEPSATVDAGSDAGTTASRSVTTNATANRVSAGEAGSPPAPVRRSSSFFRAVAQAVLGEARVNHIFGSSDADEDRENEARPAPPPPARAASAIDASPKNAEQHSAAPPQDRQQLLPSMTHQPASAPGSSATDPAPGTTTASMSARRASAAGALSPPLEGTLFDRNCVAADDAELPSFLSAVTFPLNMHFYVSPWLGDLSAVWESQQITSSGDVPQLVGTHTVVVTPFMTVSAALRLLRNQCDDDDPVAQLVFAQDNSVVPYVTYEQLAQSQSKDTAGRASRESASLKDSLVAVRLRTPDVFFYLTTPMEGPLGSVSVTQSSSPWRRTSIPDSVQRSPSLDASSNVADRVSPLRGDPPFVSSAAGTHSSQASSQRRRSTAVVSVVDPLAATPPDARDTFGSLDSSAALFPTLQDGLATSPILVKGQQLQRRGSAPLNPASREVVDLFEKAYRNAYPEQPLLEYGSAVAMLRVVERAEKRHTLTTFLDLTRVAYDPSRVEPDVSLTARTAPLKQSVRRILEEIRTRIILPQGALDGKGGPAAVNASPAALAELWCSPTSSGQPKSRAEVTFRLCQVLEILQAFRAQLLSLVRGAEPSARIELAWQELHEREKLHWKAIAVLQKHARNLVRTQRVCSEEAVARLLLVRSCAHQLVTEWETVAREVLGLGCEPMERFTLEWNHLEAEESIRREALTDFHFTELFSELDSVDRQLRLLRGDEFLRTVAAQHFRNESAARDVIFRQWLTFWNFYTTYFIEFGERKTLLRERDAFVAAIGLLRDHVGFCGRVWVVEYGRLHRVACIQHQDLVLTHEAIARESLRARATSGYLAIVAASTQWLNEREELRQQLQRMDVVKEERVARQVILDDEEMSGSMRYNVIDDVLSILWSNHRGAQALCLKEEEKRFRWESINETLRHIWRAMLAMFVAETSLYRKLIKEEESRRRLLHFLGDEVLQRLSIVHDEVARWRSLLKLKQEYLFSIQHGVQYRVFLRERDVVRDAESVARASIMDVAMEALEHWGVLHQLGVHEATWRSIITCDEAAVRGGVLHLAAMEIIGRHRLARQEAADRSSAAELFESTRFDLAIQLRRKAEQVAKLRRLESLVSLRVVGGPISKSERFVVEVCKGDTMEQVRRVIFQKIPKAWWSSRGSSSSSAAQQSPETLDIVWDTNERQTAAHTSSSSSELSMESLSSCVPLHPTDVLDAHHVATGVFRLVDRQKLRRFSTAQSQAPPDKKHSNSEQVLSEPIGIKSSSTGGGVVPQRTVASTAESPARRKPTNPITAHPSPSASSPPPAAAPPHQQPTHEGLTFRILGGPVPKNAKVLVQIHPLEKFRALWDMLQQPPYQLDLGPAGTACDQFRLCPAVLLNGKVSVSGPEVRPDDTIRATGLFGGILLLQKRKDPEAAPLAASRNGPGMEGDERMRHHDALVPVAEPRGAGLTSSTPAVPPPVPGKKAPGARVTAKRHESPRSQGHPGGVRSATNAANAAAERKSGAPGTQWAPLPRDTDPWAAFHDDDDEVHLDNSCRKTHDGVDSLEAGASGYSSALCENAVVLSKDDVVALPQHNPAAERLTASRSPQDSANPTDPGARDAKEVVDDDAPLQLSDLESDTLQPTAQTAISNPREGNDGSFSDHHTGHLREEHREPEATAVTRTLDIAEVFHCCDDKDKHPAVVISTLSPRLPPESRSDEDDHRSDEDEFAKYSQSSPMTILSDRPSTPKLVDDDEEDDADTLYPAAAGHLFHAWQSFFQSAPLQSVHPREESRTHEENPVESTHVARKETVEEPQNPSAGCGSLEPPRALSCHDAPLPATVHESFAAGGGQEVTVVEEAALPRAADDIRGRSPLRDAAPVDEPMRQPLGIVPDAPREEVRQVQPTMALLGNVFLTGGPIPKGDVVPFPVVAPASPQGTTDESVEEMTLSDVLEALRAQLPTRYPQLPAVDDWSQVYLAQRDTAERDATLTHAQVNSSKHHHRKGSSVQTAAVVLRELAPTSRARDFIDQTLTVRRRAKLALQPVLAVAEEPPSTEIFPPERRTQTYTVVGGPIPRGATKEVSLPMDSGATVGTLLREVLRQLNREIRDEESSDVRLLNATEWRLLALSEAPTQGGSNGGAPRRPVLHEVPAEQLLRACSTQWFALRNRSGRADSTRAAAETEVTLPPPPREVAVHVVVRGRGLDVVCTEATTCREVLQMVTSQHSRQEGALTVTLGDLETSFGVLCDGAGLLPTPSNPHCFIELSATLASLMGKKPTNTNVATSLTLHLVPIDTPAWTTQTSETNKVLSTSAVAPSASSASLEPSPTRHSSDDWNGRRQSANRRRGSHDEGEELLIDLSVMPTVELHVVSDDDRFSRGRLVLRPSSDTSWRNILHLLRTKVLRVAKPEESELASELEPEALQRRFILKVGPLPPEIAASLKDCRIPSDRRAELAAAHAFYIDDLDECPQSTVLCHHPEFASESWSFLFLLRNPAAPVVPPLLPQPSAAEVPKVSRSASLFDRIRSVFSFSTDKKDDGNTNAVESLPRGGATSAATTTTTTTLGFDYVAEDGSITTTTPASAMVAAPVTVRILGGPIPGDAKVVVTVLPAERVDSLFEHARIRLKELGLGEVALQLGPLEWNVHYVRRSPASQGGLKAVVNPEPLDRSATLEQCDMAKGSHVVSLRPLVTSPSPGGPAADSNAASASKDPTTTESGISTAATDTMIRLVGGPIPKQARILVPLPPGNTTYAFWYPALHEAVKKVVPVFSPDVTPDAYDLVEVELHEGKPMLRETIAVEHTPETHPLISRIVSLRKRIHSLTRTSSSAVLQAEPSQLGELVAVGSLVDLDGTSTSRDFSATAAAASGVQATLASKEAGGSASRKLSWADQTNAASREKLVVRVIGHGIPSSAKIFITLYGWMSFSAVFGSVVEELRKQGLPVPPDEEMNGEHLQLWSMSLDPTGVLRADRQLSEHDEVRCALQTKLLMLSKATASGKAERRASSQDGEPTEGSPIPSPPPPSIAGSPNATVAAQSTKSSVGTSGRREFSVRVVGRPIPAEAKLLIEMTPSTPFREVYHLVRDALRRYAEETGNRDATIRAADEILTPAAAGNAFSLVEMTVAANGLLKRKQPLDDRSTPFLSDFSVGMSVLQLERITREVADSGSRFSDGASSSVDVFTPKRSRRGAPRRNSLEEVESPAGVAAGAVGIATAIAPLLDLDGDWSEQRDVLAPAGNNHHVIDRHPSAPSFGVESRASKSSTVAAEAGDAAGFPPVGTRAVGDLIPVHSYGPEENEDAAGRNPSSWLHRAPSVVNVHEVHVDERALAALQSKLAPQPRWDDDDDLAAPPRNLIGDVMESTNIPAPLPLSNVGSECQQSTVVDRLPLLPPSDLVGDDADFEPMAIETDDEEDVVPDAASGERSENSVAARLTSSNAAGVSALSVNATSVLVLPSYAVIPMDDVDPDDVVMFSGRSAAVDNRGTIRETAARVPAATSAVGTNPRAHSVDPATSSPVPHANSAAADREVYVGDVVLRGTEEDSEAVQLYERTRLGSPVIHHYSSMRLAGSPAHGLRMGLRDRHPVSGSAAASSAEISHAVTPTRQHAASRQGPSSDEVRLSGLPNHDLLWDDDEREVVAVAEPEVLSDDLPRGHVDGVVVDSPPPHVLPRPRRSIEEIVADDDDDEASLNALRESLERQSSIRAGSKPGASHASSSSLSQAAPTASRDILRGLTDLDEQRRELQRVERLLNTELPQLRTVGAAKVPIVSSTTIKNTQRRSTATTASGSSSPPPQIPAQVQRDARRASRTVVGQEESRAMQPQRRTSRDVGGGDTGDDNAAVALEAQQLLQEQHCWALRALEALGERLPPSPRTLLPPLEHRYPEMSASTKLDDERRRRSSTNVQPNRSTNSRSSLSGVAISPPPLPPDDGNDAKARLAALLGMAQQQSKVSFMESLRQQAGHPEHVKKRR